MQRSLGFGRQLDAEELWHGCRRRLLATRPHCAQVEVQLSPGCISALRRRQGAGNADRGRAAADGPAAPEASSLREALADLLASATHRRGVGDNSNTTVATTVCGRILDGPLRDLQIRQCLEAPCPTADPSGATGALNSYDDRLMLQPALDFVGNAAAEGMPFLATLLTTATHHSYRPPLFSAPLSSAAPVGDALRAAYRERLRESDELARQLFAGLERLQLSERTLFIVVGDHGESFGEHGHWQHGSCVYLQCVWVPMVMYDPLRRVAPYLVRATSLGAPSWIDGPRRHADLPVTILDWARLALWNSSLCATHRQHDAARYAPPVRRSQPALHDRSPRPLVAHAQCSRRAPSP